MNLVFIALYYKTPFFKVVADQLEQKGHDIFWITTSKKWKSWLVNDGVQYDKILLLAKHKDYNCIDNVECNQILYNIEKRTNIKVKSVYFMDRIISRWKWGLSEKYICYLVCKIYSFLKQNNVNIVFGETTALHELVTALICEAFDIKFYNPFTVRIPSNRFAFFKGISQENFELIDTEYKSVTTNYHVEKIIESVAKEGKKPLYFYRNNKIPKVDIAFLKKVFIKLNESIFESVTDPNVKSLKYHLFFQKQYLKPLNYFLVKCTKVFSEPDLNKKYVLYTLHKQPEASIDVLGFKNANQYELIKSIVRNLPMGMSLYVKEHSNSLGDRSLSELKRIKNLPQVELINPFFDTHKLIRESELVITVSGTVAYEAALMKKRAVTLCPLFFNRFSSIYYLDNIYDLGRVINENNTTNQSDERDISILTEILENSFEGVIDDVLNNPECLSESNIRNVVNGFINLIKTLEKEFNKKLDANILNHNS